MRSPESEERAHHGRAEGLSKRRPAGLHRSKQAPWPLTSPRHTHEKWIQAGQSSRRAIHASGNYFLIPALPTEFHKQPGASPEVSPDLRFCP